MALFGSAGGPYFGKNDAHIIIPVADAASTFVTYDGADRTSATTNFFTIWAASFGTTDTTNWTANTYKTIYNNTSGKGRFASYIGCTAGGTETHTLEITIDGVLKELAFACSSGQRVWFSTYLMFNSTEFTTGGSMITVGGEAINAAKTGFTDQSGATQYVLTWRGIQALGLPLLRYDSSLLIRAKHSVDITNSTATAYSAVQHIVGL